MWGLEYKFRHLWFGDCKPQSETMDFMEHISCGKAIEVKMPSGSASSAGELCRFKPKPSLRGVKEKCTTFNQYRLKWSWLVVSKFLLSSISELRNGGLGGGGGTYATHMLWHMFPIEIDAITSPQGFRNRSQDLSDWTVFRCRSVCRIAPLITTMFSFVLIFLLFPRNMHQDLSSPKEGAVVISYEWILSANNRNP